MRAYLLVASGAIVGAASRWSIGELIDRPTGAFPWATLVVNLVGCLLAGAALGSIERDSERWLAIVTGALGGFTTYSAFAAETRELLVDDRPLVAFVYVGASLVGGLAAVEIGRLRPG